MIPGLQKISFYLLFWISSISFACDICSCGSSNASNFTGNLAGNYIGFSYSYLHFTFKENVVVEDSNIADDFINTINLTGQYYVTNRIIVNAVIPYRWNARNTSEDRVNNNGIGDITLTGLVNVLQQNSKHNLKVGVGVKLPTGKFNLQRANANQTSATQLGTGSWDVLLPIQYQLHHKKTTLGVSGTYFIKTPNSDSFKYGNQTQINASFAYQIDLKPTASISPTIGFSFDDFLPTSRFGIEDKRTSGYMLNTNMGVNAALKKVTLGINYQLPIQQNLIENEVQFRKGISVYTYWTF